MTGSLYDVCDVAVLGHYRLRLTFSDGLVGDVERAAAHPVRQPHGAAAG